MCSGCTHIFILFIAVLPLAFLVEERTFTYQYRESSNKEINISPKTHISIFNITNRSEGPSYTLEKTLHQTFIEFEETFKSIVQSMTENVPKISQDTEFVYIKFKNYASDALDVLSNKVMYAGDHLMNEIFSKIERILEEMKEEFNQLKISIDKHFNWAVKQLNQTLIRSASEYDWWTTHIKYKLRFVNDSQHYKEGCKTIDEFIHRSNMQLQSCCKISMKSMDSLCHDANYLLSESFHIIQDTIDRMQICLAENSNTDYVVPCLNLVYGYISNVFLKIVRVRHLVDNMLPLKILYTRNCFAIVMVDMKQQQSAIASKLFIN